MLFDAVLDTVGEASRAVGLLRRDGGLCPIATLLSFLIMTHTMN